MHPYDKRLIRLIGVEKFWLSKQEASDYLGIRMESLEIYRSKGLIISAEFGKKIWYTTKDLDLFNRNKVFEKFEGS